MRSKKIINMVLALALAVGAVGFVPSVSGGDTGFAIAASAAGTSGLKINENGGVYEYTGKSADVVIPSTAKYIEKEAFSKNQTIKTVTIEGDLWGINENAFYDCDNLETVTIKGDLKSYDGNGGIQDSAFKFCSNLKEVKFTKKNAAVDQIGKKAFCLCGSLKSITLPSGTACIEEEAFGDCDKLETVIFKGDVTDGEETGGIYAMAFSGCTSLKEVKFEKSNAVVDQIGEWAFNKCFALTKINIPTGTAYIYDGAFLNCESLSSVTVPAKTKVEGEYVFGYMNGYKTEKEAFLASLYFDESDEYVLADGKTSLYVPMSIDTTKITQKKITLTVTKGSSAEKWAKANKVKYKYPDAAKDSSSSDKPAAPENVKCSAKTADSVTLKWDSVSGADAYAVYIYNASTKKYEKYKTVSAAKCKVTGLKKGTKYKFVVKSLKKNGSKYVSGGSSKAVAVSTSTK